jgi:hypothetical protein
MDELHVGKVNSLIFLLVFFLSVNAQNNRITLRDGQKIFSSGMNMAWGSFANDATNLNETTFINALDDISEAGGNSMRWWLHVDGRYSPQYNGDTVSSIIQTEINNVKKILDLAYERKMRVCISLWSHDMLKGEAGEMITIRNQHMLADSAATMAYINNALIPLVYALKGHPGILCWEIFNEPEGMIAGIGWTGNYSNGGWTTYPYIKRFTNLAAGAIHRTDPDALVTTGTHRLTYLAPNYTDEALIAAGGDSSGTLDFYQAHYYTDFTAEQNPFSHSASYYGLEKPIIIGEFSANIADEYPSPELPYQLLYAAGYAGAWSWTWTGHDGNGDITDSEPGMMWLLNNHPDDIMVGNPGIIKFFFADTLIITANDSTMLMWETTDSSDVTLNGMLVNQNDTIFVKPKADSTFKLVASSPFYADSSELVIKVLYPGSIHYFTATPSNIALGESSLIQWQVIDSARVTLNNDTVSSLGSMVLTPSNDTTLTLRSYGTVQDSATITISVLDELAFNRALYKPAYSSSVETEQGITHYPGLAVDGNPGTRWSTQYSDPQWIYVDLLGFYDIKRIVCNWEAAYGDDYMIQVSDNAAEWTTIHAATDSGGGIDDIRDLSGIGRFVRMLGFSRGPNNWGYSLWEFEVYGYPQENTIVTEYADNFNDGILTGWKSDHLRTFKLSEGEGILSIDYTRTDSSEQWDNFNFTPIGNVDASAHPYINVKIKSTISTQVTFKPIYASSDDWLQKDVPGDSTWHYYTFNLTGLSSTPISKIYMYLDAGQPNLIASGTVQFDDLTIGITPVSIGDSNHDIPLTYSLGNAYPNPFNPSTNIQFTVLKAEKVKLIVYDVLGRKVKVLFNDIAQAGVNKIIWHGKNDHDIKMSSGIYFYRLETESGFVDIKKMILVK